MGLQTNALALHEDFKRSVCTAVFLHNFIVMSLGGEKHHFPAVSE